MKDRYIIAVLAVFLQIAVLVGCSGRESNSIEIASVNGEKILASDFDLAKAQYESKNMLDAELLDGLIKERIVLQYGEKIEDIITEEDVVLVSGVRDPVLSGATNRFLSENRKPIDRIS